MLNLFLQGVPEYGLPLGGRTDHRLENIEVARYMLVTRGADRGSIITGSSVHNCRVDAGVLCCFAKIFDGMEQASLLDLLNDLHLYALHFVYISMINRALKEYVAQWNNHPISTEKNLFPLQMYVGRYIAEHAQ